MKMSVLLRIVGVLAASFVALPAFAQSSAPFSTSSSGSNDWSSGEMSRPADWLSKSPPSKQAGANKQNLGIGLNTAGFVVGGGRWEVSNGGVVELDVVWRRAINPNSNLRHDSRIEVGAIGRLGFTPDAAMFGAGVPIRLVLGASDHVEMDFALHLTYARIYFTNDLFVPRNGFIPSIRWEIGYFVERRLSLGMTPFALSVVTGERVDPFVTYEPSLWIRYSPI